MKIFKTLNNNKFLILASIFVILWSIAPIIWTIIVSISPQANLSSKPPVFNIDEMSIRNYITLLFGNESESMATNLTAAGFRKTYLNTIIVSMLTIAICTSLSTMSGYAFSRFSFFGKRFLFLTIILILPIPFVVVIIPLLKIMNFLHLVDSYLGLALVYSAVNLPITTWLSTSYFLNIPGDLEDAAYIDGCSPWQTFFKIMIPLGKPVIGANMIIIFLFSWCNFFIPLILSSKDAKMVTVMIAELQGKEILERGLMSAAGLIAIIPPIIIALFFSKFIISGLTKGAIK